MDKFLIKKRIYELIDIIHTQYNSAGGALHIVIDNKNISDNDIQWCLDNSIIKIENEEEKKIYTECAMLLLKLSYSSRKRTLNQKRYIKCDGDEIPYE